MNNDEEHIIIYKSPYYDKKRKQKHGKVIVFDLDETLGDFNDLELLWNGIQMYTHQMSDFELFKKLLDLYPEFLRYGIISILEYLYQKKKSKLCKAIYIYTNNQSPPKWIKMVTNYFNYKLNLKTNENLFDKTVHAFKINNKKIEPRRTTHKKTIGDLINCTLIPENTEICFVDNTNFESMKTEKVYYIQPMSYYHHLSNFELTNRFIHSNLAKEKLKSKHNIETFKNYIFSRRKNNDYFLNDIENNYLLKTNILVSQKIMYHVKEFFYFSERKEKTKKNKKLMNRMTRKK